MCDEDPRITAWKKQYADRMRLRLTGEDSEPLPEDFLVEAADAGWECQLDLDDGDVEKAISSSPVEACDDELSNWD